MLKKLLLASAASVLVIGAAQAADVEAPPAVYDWTGGYIGIQGGYAWGKTESETDLDADFDAVDSLDVDDFEANGFVGGAHIGYLLQSDSFVYGIEGDIEYADLKDKVDIDFTDGGAVGDGGEAEKNIDWLGSLRLRAGIAADRALFYATGGLAVGGVSLETDLSPVATGIGLSNDDYNKTKWGWTLGAGVEYAVTDALSARIEYRYTDLGKSDVRVEDANGVGVDGETDNDFHAVRAGLSWHFNQ